MFSFGDHRAQACRRCAKPLTAADFEFDRAMLLLGRPYCSGCLKDVQRACHGCKKVLRQSDFDAGRALTLGVDLYCDGCLEKALKTARPAAILPPSAMKCLEDHQREQSSPEPSVVPAPAPPRVDADSRRATSRFVPPLDCILAIRPSGIRGFLGGNAVRLWVDVSEGGLRVVIAGRYKEGDIVQGHFAHASLKSKLVFRAQVRYSKAAEKFPGCTLVGLQFEKASADLMPFIRGVLGQNVTLTSSPPKQPPASAKSA
jgi:hypothetical protein